jgi:sugar O-acyltransferase (sialic acid O-acetyltransferase NeuD family)
MKFVLAGAGAHAKGVVEALELCGRQIAVYVDPKCAAWLNATHETDDDAVSPEVGALALGLGAVRPDELERRLALLDRYLARGFSAPPIVHPAAVVSRRASLEHGAIVLAGAVVQPDARVGRGAIVNTRAVVEHDSLVGEGAHVAPGAIALGGVSIGACCMIGAGAVVLPGATVPAMTTVPALTRHGVNKRNAESTVK